MQVALCQPLKSFPRFHRTKMCFSGRAFDIHVSCKISTSGSCSTIIKEMNNFHFVKKWESHVHTSIVFVKHFVSPSWQQATIFFCIYAYEVRFRWDWRCKVTKDFRSWATCSRTPGIRMRKEFLKICHLSTSLQPSFRLWSDTEDYSAIVVRTSSPASSSTPSYSSLLLRLSSRCNRCQYKPAEVARISRDDSCRTERVGWKLLGGRRGKLDISETAVEKEMRRDYWRFTASNQEYLILTHLTQDVVKLPNIANTLNVRKQVIGVNNSLDTIPMNSPSPFCLMSEWTDGKQVSVTKKMKNTLNSCIEDCLKIVQ